MGEYIRKGNNEIKLGTCESLYYMTIPQFLKDWNQFDSTKYDFINPKYGFRFRFPFPDEYRGKNWEYPENIHNFSRCEPLDIEWSNIAGEKGTLGIIQERIINNRIEPVFKLTKDSYGAFRVDEDEFLKIVYAIREKCVELWETTGDFDTKVQAMRRANFLMKIVNRMFEGWATEWDKYFKTITELKEELLKAEKFVK